VASLSRLRPGVRSSAVLLVASVTVLGLACSGPARAKPAVPPPIKHVFVIVLENENESATFASNAYLKGLAASGAFLPSYYGIGHESNDNYLAMISGQAPNPQTQADCQIYDDFIGAPPLPGTPVFPGQAVGTGCVYPASVPTLADQLAAAHLTWKGYMEDMGNIPSREAATCGHPTLDAQDNTQTAVAGDGYAARHDPFVYFHSIIDTAQCRNVVAMGTPTGTNGLARDLATGNVPSLSFIVPNLCDDGHDFPCVNERSPSTSGIGDIDHFLQTWLPKIQASPAYARSMVAIVFDEASGPPSGDSTACCGEVAGPNSPLPGIDGPGGGKTGAVLLSPLLRKGRASVTSYNHYSLLASLEALYGVSRLGYAQTVPATFWTDPAISRGA
jgi:phosphatidylinositol-3-phosphatase